MMISIFDIVVGDVIHLMIRDQVDLMAGCKVADGCSTMMVTSVGMNTEWGLFMASISNNDIDEERPLQVRLSGVAMFIGKIGLLVAVSVLVILLIRFFTGYIEDDEGKVEFITGKTSVKDAMDGVVKIFTVVKNDPPNDTSTLPPKIVSLLVESVAHNTSSSVFSPEGGRDVEVSGSPTEKAILQWGVKVMLIISVIIASWNEF
uniref:Uncharacterized protein n=1 Tax=Lactuca sativa TaxID=4236 RepID=A0A9R1WLY6_LACSA|nr:hypothetical protein LSAT_V11C100047820 [Lactuca sativa]